MQRITSKVLGVLIAILFSVAAVTTASLHNNVNASTGFSVISQKPLTLELPNQGLNRPGFNSRRMLPPSASPAAACSQWDVTGVWKFVQTNDTSPEFTLLLTENGLKGSAVYWYEYNDSGYYFPRRASVDGSINGDSFEVTAYWDNGTTGVYTAKIGPQGRIQGSTYDKQHPQTRADFYSDRLANCASRAACTRWDMSGSWTFVQSNDTSPIFSLKQTNTGLQGTATHFYTHKSECKFAFCGDDYYKHTASVNGAINGNSIEITAYWSNGTIGLYTGKIGPEGRIEGATHNKENPQTTARWYSDRTAKCLAPPAAVEERTGTTSSALSTVPPPEYIGTFGTTPPNYQPLWVYGIRNNGELVWYRKNSGTSNWEGPKLVGNGWHFKDVIPAGGNSFYALTDDGRLNWYQHSGFNDGTREWKAQVKVGHGWKFSQIFSGGEGIIYAITNDGKLLWYKHNGYLTGAGLTVPGAWESPKEVGHGWNGFEQVFSSGGGIIYVITKEGKLRWYKHNGYQTGAGLGTAGAWDGPKEVGHGWNGFHQVIPAGGGVILIIQNDGKLRWYKHNGYLSGAGLNAPGAWEGPTEVGNGWHGFKKVIALLPVSSAPVVR